MSRTAFLGLFLVALLASLAVRAPASVLAGPIAAALPPDIRLGRLEGSVWSGRSLSLLFRGTDFGTVSWRVAGVSLAPVGVRLDLTIDGPGGLASGTAVTSPSGGPLQVQHLTGKILPGVMAAMLGIDQVAITGTLDLDLASAEFDPALGRLTEVDGRLDWRGAAVTAPIALSFGDASLALVPRDDGAIDARVLTMGGDLGVDGTVVVETDGRFRVEAGITTTPAVSGQLASGLALLAPAGPDGVHRLTYQGRLWQ